MACISVTNEFYANITSSHNLGMNSCISIARATEAFNVPAKDALMNRLRE